MECPTNLQTMKTELNNLDYDLQKFQNCNTRIRSLADEENVHEGELLANQVDERIFEEKTKILKWLKRYDESVNTRKSH